MKGMGKKLVTQVFDLNRAKLNVKSYAQAVETTCNPFMWSLAIDQAASSFWDETISATSGISAAWAATLTAEDDCNADLMEAYELEMTVLGLVPAEL